MTHPLDRCNEEQKKFLERCPPEQRRFHELLFIVGNATYRYHQQARTFNPSRQDWEEWIEGLPVEVREHFRVEGFEKAKGVLSFTRYVMEKNDIGLEEFLNQHIAPELLAEYRELTKDVGE